MSISAAAGTPYHAHVIEGDSSAVEIHLYTDVGFAYVEWYANGALAATHTGDGTGTYDSLSGYDFAGLGSTSGNFVTIKAVAYRNPSNTNDHAVGYT